MSDPTRTQRRGPPLQSKVVLRRNYPVLPSIRNNESSEISAASPVSLTNVDPICETPSEDQRDFWTRFHEDLQVKNESRPVVVEDPRTISRVVRIFVSSTFTDFFNEREILIKKVFPELRERMEPLGIQIVDCDLRWGVPKDSSNEQTILTCMEELDRCREENGQPFFIGLLGDKYGWVPKRNALPTEIVQRYRWLDGASITLMEFVHGALRTRNPNALFLIRNSDKILPNLPEKFMEKFVDRDASNRKEIDRLKSELRQIVGEEQIFRYNCFFSGLDSSSGRERVKIEGLEEFQRQVTSFLEKAIDKRYEHYYQSAKSKTAENQRLTSFLLNKTQFYVERTDEFELLFDFLSKDPKKLSLIRGDNVGKENSTDQNEKQPILALKGRSGEGKTSLLAKFVLHIEETMKDRFLLCYHFLDGEHPLNFNNVAMTSVAEKIYKHLESNDLLTDEKGSLTVENEFFFERALKLIRIPLVIIVDGLEKGDFRHQGDYRRSFPLVNLSYLSSSQSLMIISCETNGRLLQTIKDEDHFEIELESWTVEKRQIYVERFFRQFNKTLEPQQIQLLINNKSCESPAYLSFICENLRQFGDYSLVTKRLQSYPEKMDQLISFLIDEAYALVENRPLLDAFFKLLIVSDVGLLESDIVNLLNFYINKQSTNDTSNSINLMTWSTARRYIKVFLDFSWIFNQQSTILRHGLLEKVLQKRLFNDQNADEIRLLHSYLAEFFQKQPSFINFAIRQIPFHLEKAKMYKEMIDFLRSTNSRGVSSDERRTYLQKRCCTKMLPHQDGMLSQRAYLCHLCAMQFKLGPFTMAKSSCAICTNMIIGSFANDSTMKREARLCIKHGFQGYPATIQCYLCKMLRPRPPVGKSLSNVADPVPLNICLQCSFLGKGTSRCCALELTDT